MGQHEEGDWVAVSVAKIFSRQNVALPRFKQAFELFPYPHGVGGSLMKAGPKS